MARALAGAATVPACPDTKGGNMGSVIIGLGANRKHTARLAKILNEPKPAWITHEHGPCLPWDTDVDRLASNLARLELHIDRQEFVGDVAFYWLNYLDQVLELYPDARIIVVDGDKDEAVRDFLDIIDVRGAAYNHWASGEDAKPHVLDVCFPESDAEIEDAIGAYYDAYMAGVDAFSQRHPSRILRVLAKDLGSAQTQDEIFSFAGIENPGLVAIPPSYTFKQEDLEDDRPSVFIALPNLGEIATLNVVTLMAWAVSRKYRLYFFPKMGVTPADRARNHCVREFLENSDQEYLLFLDADTAPALDIIDRLIAADKPMVSAATQTWRRADLEEKTMLLPMSFRKNNDGHYQAYVGKGLEQVDMATLSCCLIRREVLQAVHDKFGIVCQFKLDGDYGENMIGEDFDFSMKVQDCGFEIWTDFAAVCHHYKTLDTAVVNAMLIEMHNAAVLATFKAVREKDDRFARVSETIEKLNTMGEFDICRG